MGIVTDALREKIKQLDREGYATGQIAKMCNIPEHIVDKVLHRL